MAGGEPVMSFYGPIYDSVRPSPDAAAPITVDWDHERREWSRIHGQAREHYQQYQLKKRKDQHQAKRLLQQREAREKAQAEHKRKTAEQTSSLVRYKRLWWVSVFGLFMSGIIFVVLFTDLLRDMGGSQLGIKTKLDSGPSLMDSSNFPVVFWIAVAMDIVSRAAAGIAVVKVVTLSEALHENDAAYWKRLHGFSTFGIGAGAAMASVFLSWLLLLTVRGKCDGNFCLHLQLASLAVITWILLVCIGGALFLETGHRAITGLRKIVSGMLMRKKRSQEVPKKSG